MTPEKTVNNGSGNSVNIGDKLDFGIKVAIPSDIGDSEYKVFNINDKLDEALTYLTNSTKVYAYKFVNNIWEKVEVTTGVNAVLLPEPIRFLSSLQKLEELNWLA